MANILNAPRREYSRDIAHYIASGWSTKDNNYQAGLIFLACIIGGIAFIWCFVLLVFKCKGKDAGCSAGYPFERGSFDHHDYSLDEHQPGSKVMSTDLEDDTSGSALPTASRGSAKPKPPMEMPLDDNLSFHSSIPSEEGSSFGHRSIGDYTTESELMRIPSRRERRTQIAFLLFSLITITAIPLALIYCFAPLKDTTEGTKINLQELRDLADQVKFSVDIVSSATNSSLEIVAKTPLDLDVLCPNRAQDDTAAIFGFQLAALVQAFQTDYATLEQYIKENITSVADVLSDVDETIDAVDLSYSYVHDYLWIMPGVLLFLGMLTALTVFGVFLAWRQDSNLRFQRTLSYVILPLFIATSLTCWAIAIAAAVTTAATSDACLYDTGSAVGTPDAIAAALLNETATNQEDNKLYNLLIPYVNGCNGEDPTRVLNSLEQELQIYIDYIWSHVSLVDSAGRAQLMELCGSESLNDFLAGLRDLAKLLTSIRRALDSTSSSLSCERINPLYIEVVHVSVCTDTISATSWGFLLFFVIGISTMCMITLRASYRYTIQDEKVLEEDEVAENMIVDEHEEYLAYISKYRHEWQEYDGLDGPLPHGPIQEQHASMFDSTEPESQESECSEYYSSEDEHELHLQVDSPYEQGRKALYEDHQDHFDPYGTSDTDARSQSTGGDISFPSLRADGEDGSNEEKVTVMPPPLLCTQGSEDVDDILEPTQHPMGLLSMSSYQYSLQAAIHSSSGSSQGSNSGQFASDDDLLIQGQDAIEIVSPTEEEVHEMERTYNSINRPSHGSSSPTSHGITKPSSGSSRSTAGSSSQPSRWVSPQSVRKRPAKRTSPIYSTLGTPMQLDSPPFHSDADASPR